MEDLPLANELFATETMAELCARQGRTADAVAIYSRLLEDDGPDDRRQRWTARLEALRRLSPGLPPAGSAGATTKTIAAAPPPSSNPPGSRPPQQPPRQPVPPSAAPARSPDSRLSLPRLSLLVEAPVRSGQVIYAEDRDLIVLAPVNPGAQLIADGHIHVYAPLRGRAVAGAHGYLGARIFCQRLEAELVGIDSAYVTYDDLPPERFGKPAQVLLRDGRCVIAPV